MAEPKLEKQVCVNCGADVRPGTQFCFSCGRSVMKVEEMDAGTEPAGTIPNESLAQLERALAASRTEGSAKANLGTAAGQRKRARSGNRKPLEVVWEPADSSVIYFIAVALVFVLAIVVVYLTRAAR